MKEFMRVLIMMALSTWWPMWLSSRARGVVFVMASLMPIIAFVTAEWMN